MITSPHSHRAFLESALTFDGVAGRTVDVLAWLREQSERVNVRVEKIPFSAMESWGFDESRSALRHESGRFFSIEGIRVRTNSDYIAEWDQPIINQPEVGSRGTGAGVNRAVIVDDPNLGESVVPRSMVYLALSYDHRQVDGADAARFLTTIKERLEAAHFESELGLG